MNKKFSTLLAGILLAGSSFSAMAQKVLEPEKYYHVALAASATDRLIIGHSADGKRDSVAFVTADDAAKSYEAFNATLWKPTVKEVIDEKGHVSYEFNLENKDGQVLAISKKNVSASQKKFYQAQYAYVTSDGLSSMNAEDGSITIAEDGTITITGAQEARTNFYDAAAKKNYQYALVKREGEVKVMMAEAEAGKEATVTPDGGQGEILKLQLVDVDTPYSMTVTDLNENPKDEAFELVFSNDVKNSTIGNLLSGRKLRAVEFESMFTTATTGTNSFKADLAAAKDATDKAVTKLDAALTATINSIEEVITLAKNTGNTKNDDPTTIGELFPEQAKTAEETYAELNTALEAFADGTAEGTLIKALKDANAKVNALKGVKLAKDKKLANDAKELKEYQEALAAAKKLFGEVKDATNKAYTVVDSTMTAFMDKPYLGTNDKPDFESASPKAQIAMFATAASGKNKVYDQYSTTIQGKLDAVKTSATKEKFGVSKDILADAAKGYYAIAIVDSMIDGKQAYLSVDTNYVARNERYFSFKADTLTTVGKEEENTVVAAKEKNIYLFAFQLQVAPEKIAGDEVTVNTFMPDVNNLDGTWYKEGFKATNAVVVIRSLAKTHREVSVAADKTDPAYYNSTITIKQVVRETAKLEKGTPYYVKSLKKEYETKPYYMMTSTTGDKLAHSAIKYANVPAAQWFVSSADDDASKYAIANRDFNLELVKAQKFYVIDAEKQIYEVEGDTIQLEEVKAIPAGYKNLSKEAIDNQTYKLTATNFANPTKTFYLTMNTDSSVVMTDDAESSLEFKMKTNAAENLKDATLKANKYNGEVYFGNDTLFLTMSASNKVVLTKKATKNEADLTLRRTSDKAAQYEILWRTAEDARNTAKKVAVDQNGYVVVVGPTEITNWAFDLEAATIDIYHKFADAPKNVIISLMNDEASKVTAVKPFAEIKRTGLELKAAATDNDFVLGLDTAYVEREDNFRYAYYITKAVDTEKVGAFDRKAYMVSYKDSVDQKRSNDTIQYSQENLTRVGFVYANRVENASGDSLAIERLPKAAKSDTLDIAAKMGYSNATWAFVEDEKAGDYYRIEVAASKDAAKQYVSYLNGILVLGDKDQAQLFAIKDTELAPTDNDNVSVSEVSVIASEGKVTISGAAGKKVVISNMLGQVKANTILASDSETIAVPAGVVVVAVEGEEAVKAIVE